MEETSVLAPLQGGWGAKKRQRGIHWGLGGKIAAEGRTWVGGQNGMGGWGHWGSRAKRTDGKKVPDKKLKRIIISSKLTI